MGIVQATLWAHANSIAQAAAEAGAEAASAFGAVPSEGVAAAEAFMAEAGGIRDTSTNVSGGEADSETVTVVVTGSYPGVFGSLDVRATATIVRERLPG